MKLKLLSIAAVLLGLLYSPSVARPDDCDGCNAHTLPYAAMSGTGCNLALKWTVFSYDGFCEGVAPECFQSPCEFELFGEYQSCCDDNRLQWVCGGSSGQGLVPASCGVWTQFAHCWVIVDCGTSVNGAHARILGGNSWIERGVLLFCSACN